MLDYKKKLWIVKQKERMLLTDKAIADSQKAI